MTGSEFVKRVSEMLDDEGLSPGDEMVRRHLVSMLVAHFYYSGRDPAVRQQIIDDFNRACDDLVIRNDPRMKPPRH